MPAFRKFLETLIIMIFAGVLGGSGSALVAILLALATGGLFGLQTWEEPVRTLGPVVALTAGALGAIATMLLAWRSIKEKEDIKSQV